MKRISFTVRMKSGINYDADQLTATNRDGDLHPILSFVCSGRQMVFPAEEVEAVEFHAEGATHCPRCDQDIANFGVST